MRNLESDKNSSEALNIYIKHSINPSRMEFTAIIRKGEKQYVALCPEVDVVSQGHSVEEAMKNLKEAVELHIEEVGLPEGFDGNEAFVARFQLANAKTA
jgi:predicted RNase H-like HicB family nuclease